jgi:Zn-dependent peptidase ImmA (M78 family)
MNDRGGDKLEAYYASLQEHAPDIYQQADDKADMMAQDVMNEIDALQIDYSFESLNGALGIAKHDKCIISNKALTYNPAEFMFILFHELGHYHQYRKYGDDFALSIYTNDQQQIEEDLDKLLWIENTANRFALMKTKFYIDKYEMDLRVYDVSGGYSNKNMIRGYIRQVKQLVQQMPPESRNIRDINEMIYNLVN